MDSTQKSVSAFRPPLFLIGYMACGKTTFGRALARASGRQFIDLDFYIEQRFRMSIKEIFETKGEAEFRRMESAMLREAGEFDNVVIACGGGTPCFNDNIGYMNSRGATLFLDTPVERIVMRLVANRNRRPLMAGKAETEIRAAVEAGLKERTGVYMMAGMTFSGELLESKAEIDAAVRKFISEYPEA